MSKEFGLIGFAVLVVTITAAAQAPERGIAGSGATGGPQKWAILIGVGDYQDSGLSDLPNAVNDANRLAGVLAALPDGFPPENIMLLSSSEDTDRQPTRSNLLRYLGSRLALVGPQDTILVYFAGHGVTEGGALYLMPADAALVDIRRTGFAYSMLKEMIEGSPCKRNVLILDACHSATGRASERMDPNAIQELEHASEGMITLASCGAEELSHDMPDSGHGAFTYFLIQGLSGQADTDANGLISASELSNYTWDATRRWASELGLKQTPWRLERVAGEIYIARAGGDTANAAAFEDYQKDRQPGRRLSDIESRFLGDFFLAGVDGQVNEYSAKFSVSRVGDEIIVNSSNTSTAITDVKLDGSDLRFNSRGTYGEFWSTHECVASLEGVAEGSRIPVAWKQTGGNSGTIGQTSQAYFVPVSEENAQFTGYRGYQGGLGSDGMVETCFIATATHGTPWQEDVVILREFRDRRLLTNAAGAWFVTTYYRISPPIADAIAAHPWAKRLTRVALKPLVVFAGVSLGRPDSIVTALSILLGVAVFVELTARRRRRRIRPNP